MASNGVSYSEQLVDVMLGESTQGLQSDLLEKIRTSDIESHAELPRCDLRKLGPPPLQLSPEVLERIRKAGKLVKRKSRATRSKKR